MTKILNQLNQRFLFFCFLWGACLAPLNGETQTATATPVGPESLRLSMVTTNSDGGMRIGMEDTTDNQVYLLDEGQTFGRVTFIKKDPANGMVLVEKNHIRAWLSISGLVEEAKTEVVDRPATEGVGVLTAEERRQMAATRRRNLNRIQPRPLNATP